MQTAYIGTYTTGQSRGIYRVQADENGFGACDLAAEARSPAYLARREGLLFSVEELEEGGILSCYAVGDKGLTLLSSQPVGGAAACHIAERDGWLAIANYSDGSVSVFRHENGMISPRAAHIVHAGHGPNPDRQEAPHAHFCAFAPDGRLCVCDLGLDKIMMYDPAAWTFSGYAATLPGAGPRHMVFSGQRAFVVNELACTVEVFDIAQKQWNRLQSLPTLPEGFSGASTCAAIKLCGEFVVASNRGHDSLAVFRIDDDLLSPVGIYPCGGREPRDFAFLPGGEAIVCGLQHDDALALLPFYAKTGEIGAPIARLDVPAPVCIAFA